MRRNLNNYDIPEAVRRKSNFRNRTGSVYATTCRGPYGWHYVVYSFGGHYPAAIYSSKQDRWFYNTSSYSNTTARHMRYVRSAMPYNAIGLSNEDMVTLNRESPVDPATALDWFVKVGNLRKCAHWAEILARCSEKPHADPAYV
jgi:hypothetical protein